MLNGPDTLETVKAWPVVPPPTQGEAVPPPSHGEFLDALLAEVKSRHWRTGPVSGVVSRAGSDLAAGFTISGPSWVQGSWTPALAVVRSTTWRTPLRFYAGAVGDVLGGHNPAVVYHCWQIDRCNTLKELASVAVDGWVDQAKLLPRVLKELRRRKVDKGEAGRLLFEAGRTRLPFGRTGAERVMPGSRVFQVDNQFRDMGGKDALDLLVAFGTVAQQNSAVDQLDQLATFYTMTTARQTAGA